MCTTIHKNLVSRSGIVCFNSTNLYQKLVYSLWHFQWLLEEQICKAETSVHKGQALQHPLVNSVYHLMTKRTVSDSARLTSELSGTSAARGAAGNLFPITETGILKLSYSQLCDHGRCIMKTKMPVLSLQQQLFTGNTMMNTAMFQHEHPMLRSISLTCSNMSM